MSDPSLYAIAYYALYAVALASVVAILIAVISGLRKNGAGLDFKRLLKLGKDEAERTFRWDPVQLMHVAIVLGVGLSILMCILDPIWSSIQPLRIILLILSLPLDIGLLAAFAWRVQRFRQSKRVEKQLGKESNFSNASSQLQFILILTILFTTSELILGWFARYAITDIGLNIVRNGLVVGYYSKPVVSLIENFDRPQSEVSFPFKLSEVLEGKTDISQVKIGVGNIADFDKRERISYDSCVEIGACESSCPATASGRSLSPRVLVREISALAREKGESVDVFGTVKEDELWSCTSCGACVNSCPVQVKHLDIIYDLRRSLVNAGKLDKEKLALLQNLSQNQNPYGLGSSSRADWAKDQGID
nr:(Fe-S)-binding protein [Nitrososphaerota archaeon]